MVTDATAKGALFLKRSGEDQLAWHMAIRLLEKGEYEQLADLLQKLKTEAEQSDETFLVNLLAAIEQICHTCRQYQVDVEFQEQAYKRAINRKQELHKQLRAILGLAGQQEMTEVQNVSGLLHPSPHTDLSSHERQATASVGPRQRILSLLGFKPLKSKDMPSPAISGSKAAAKDPAETPEIASAATIAPASNSPTLAVYTFGIFRVYVSDKLVDKWSGNIAKSLFKYMVLHREGLIPNELLMDTFWQEAEPESARRNLYQAIYLVRQVLQPFHEEFPFILSSNGAYGLNPALVVWLDCEVFEAQYLAGQRLEREGRVVEALTAYEVADSLYEGAFLADELYADWASVQRHRLQQEYFDILSRLCHHYYVKRQWGICIAYGQRLLGKDNCHEETHRQIMLAYYQQGQRHLALRQYHRCVEALRDELGVVPLPETAKLYRQLQQNEINFSRPQN